MAWLGFVPSEHSPPAAPPPPSGPHHAQWQPLGPRTLLVEAAWAYRYAPKVSPIIEQRAQDIDPKIRALAWKAQLRLTHKYRRLIARGKHANLAVDRGRTRARGASSGMPLGSSSSLRRVLAWKRRPDVLRTRSAWVTRDDVMQQQSFCRARSLGAGGKNHLTELSNAVPNPRISA